LARQVEERTKRKLLLLLILAPGIFFLAYWAIFHPGADVITERVQPPERYVALGRGIVVEGKSYTVRGGSKIFTDVLQLSDHNVAVAEPGRIFAGLCLNTKANAADTEVELINEQGKAYAPLAVKREVIVRNFGFDENDDYLFMFKVDANSKRYYFRVNKDPRLTWLVVDR